MASGAPARRALSPGEAGECEDVPTCPVFSSTVLQRRQSMNGHACSSSLAGCGRSHLNAAGAGKIWILLLGQLGSGVGRYDRDVWQALEMYWCTLGEPM